MYTLAIDIGGTKIALGILDFNGKIIDSVILASPVKAAPQKVIFLIAKELKKLIKKNNLPHSKIKGAGVGMAGQILPKEGLVVASPNLPKWQKAPLKKPLEKLLKIPVFIDNDANAAALGELYFGAGRNEKDFLYVTLSTGIGAGIVIGGRIYGGAANIAGEVGHMVIKPDGPLCGCGQRGCFEALASGKYFARHAREELKKFPGRTILRQLIKNNPKNLDAKILSKAVRKNDAFAKKVWAESADYLKIGFANLVNIFNPSLIIIGGGFSKAGDLVFKPIRTGINRRANSPAAKSVRVVPAKLRENSGLFGAAALVLAGTKAGTKK